MKKLVSLTLIFLLALFPMIASCETLADSIEVFPQQKTIKAVGTASIQMNPDCANINMGVDTYDTQIANALTKNQEIVQGVMDAMVSLGLSKDCLVTTQRELTTVYGSTENYTSNARIKGYRVKQVIFVHTDDVSLVGDIINQATEKGVSTVDSIIYGCSDANAVYDEALTLAIKEATRKASLMAKESNVTVGKVISMEEVINDSSKNKDNQRQYYEGLQQLKIGTGAETQVIGLMSQNLVFTANVIVVFDIDQTK